MLTCTTCDLTPASASDVHASAPSGAVSSPSSSTCGSSMAPILSSPGSSSWPKPARITAHDQLAGHSLPKGSWSDNRHGRPDQRVRGARTICPGPGGRRYADILQQRQCSAWLALGRVKVSPRRQLRTAHVHLHHEQRICLSGAPVEKDGQLLGAGVIRLPGLLLGQRFLDCRYLCNAEQVPHLRLAIKQKISTP